MDISTISIEDQLDYATSATLPAAMLFALTASEDIEVLCTLASNPRIDAATMEELAFKGILDTVDTTYRVRAAVAQRCDLPVYIAEGMKSDPHWTVRHYIAANEHIAPYLSWDGQAPALVAEVREAVAA